MNLLRKYLPLGIGLGWILWVALDYFQKHLLYDVGISTNIYVLPIILSFTLPLFVVYAIKKQWIRSVNGIALVSLGFLLYSIYLAILKGHLAGDTFQFKDVAIFSFLAKFILYLLGTAVIILASFSIGHFVLNRLKFSFKGHIKYCINLSLGFAILHLFIFFLAALQILKWYTVAPLLLVFVALSLVEIKNFIQEILFKRQDLQNINWLGATSFGVISVSIIISLSQAVTFYPKGFDALNYYSRIPNMVVDSGSLAYGFRAYAWSLIQSLGRVIFNSVEITNLLSSFGGVLVFYAIYTIATKQLALSKNTSLLGLALLATLPVFTTQMSHELKIDLAHLFVQLTALMLLLETFKKKSNSPRHFILLGVLIGFCITIKLSSLILLLSAIAIIPWKAHNHKLSLASTFIILAAVIILGIDRLSGLELNISGRYVVGSIAAIAGMFLMIKEFQKNSQVVFANFKNQFAVIALSSIMFFPWLVKNATECGSLSISCIINGDEPGMQLNIKEMDELYKKSKK